VEGERRGEWKGREGRRRGVEEEKGRRRGEVE
jgi:hypothetical protein